MPADHAQSFEWHFVHDAKDRSQFPDEDCVIMVLLRSGKMAVVTFRPYHLYMPYGGTITKEPVWVPELRTCVYSKGPVPLDKVVAWCRIQLDEETYRHLQQMAGTDASGEVRHRSPCLDYMKPHGASRGSAAWKRYWEAMA